MTREIGSVGNVTYYADYLVGLFGYHGLQIEIRTYAHGQPLVLTKDLGRVRSREHAEDIVLANLTRQRKLAAAVAGEARIDASKEEN